MKRWSLVTLTVLVALPFFAIGEPMKPAAEEELFTPAETELAKSDGNECLTPDDASLSAEVERIEGECLVCRCLTRNTGPVTRVGSTCSNARHNAADAARAMAVCDNEEDACGPVTHSVGPCSPNPAGAGFQATATATYKCEECFFERC